MDDLLDAARSGIQYGSACDRYMELVGARKWSELGEREREVIIRFQEYYPFINRFARKMHMYTDFNAHEELARAIGDEQYECDLFFEITAASGWVTKLVEFCVRERWWRTLETAILAYALDFPGRHVDPRVPDLLDAAYASGFQRTIWA